MCILILYQYPTNTPLSHKNILTIHPLSKHTNRTSIRHQLTPLPITMTPVSKTTTSLSELSLLEHDPQTWTAQKENQLRYAKKMLETFPEGSMAWKTWSDEVRTSHPCLPRKLHPW